MCARTDHMFEGMYHRLWLCNQWQQCILCIVSRTASRDRRAACKADGLVTREQQRAPWKPAEVSAASCEQSAWHGAAAVHSLAKRRRQQPAVCWPSLPPPAALLAWHPSLAECDLTMHQKRWPATFGVSI